MSYNDYGITPIGQKKNLFNPNRFGNQLMVEGKFTLPKFNIGELLNGKTAMPTEQTSQSASSL